jgi:hypothetical protein
MTRLTRLTLRLARNPEAGFADGADDRGYVLVAPLDQDERLDPVLWRDTKDRCTVRRFSPVSGESADGLLTHHDGHWRFTYDDEDEGPDEAGWKLASHQMVVGAYVTITSGGGVPLVYRITEALRLPV